MTTRQRTGYWQQVEVFTRDKATGEVKSTPFVVRGEGLVTRQAAIQAAIDEWEAGIAGSVNPDEETVLGAAYVSTLELTPGPAVDFSLGGGGAPDQAATAAAWEPGPASPPPSAQAVPTRLGAANRGDLSDVDLAMGNTLTAEGTAVLQALGPAGHPALAAITNPQAKVAAAITMLRLPGEDVGWVQLADVRDLIGVQLSRSDLDATLMAMYRAGQLDMTEQVYGLALNAQRRQAAAIQLGATEVAHIALRGQS
jgi:hypothetical protein